jgi:hypothetical protein
VIRWRRSSEIRNPCRDERCEIHDLHPVHAIAQELTRDQKRLRENYNRRRRHRRRIAKLKKLQAANNRRILLGR